MEKLKENSKKPYKFSEGSMPIVVYAENLKDAQDIYQSRLSGES